MSKWSRELIEHLYDEANYERNEVDYCELIEELASEIDELEFNKKLSEVSDELRPARFLCMCEGGHNRSGALALQLKQRGVDAIQIGWKFNTKETINTFAKWADFIVLMQPWNFEITKIDEKLYGSKVRVMDVGPDVWGSNTNMALNRLLVPFVEEWEKRNFKL